MIVGYFRAGVAFPFLDVDVAIAPFVTRSESIPFVIDTGATRTLISALDAGRFLGVSREWLESGNWPGDPVIGTGVGGSSKAREVEASLVLHHDDGGSEEFSIRVLVGEYSSLFLPSLLGWDILKMFNLEIRPRERSIRLT